MRFPHKSLAIVFAILSLAIQAHAQDSMQRWQSFDFAKTRLKPADVSRVPLEDLKLMRGIVFGKHGRIFKDAEIRTYLEAQDWFKPNPDLYSGL